jgi:hypothetical protein
MEPITGERLAEIAKGDAGLNEVARWAGTMARELQQRRQADRWIPVEEKLPGPQPMSEIVYGCNGRSVGLYRYWWSRGQFERLVTPDGWEKEVLLTHWRPAPAPERTEK